ncbi:MAG: hypothetical protein ABMB14_12850, partial [Myxococcota bacterium]
MDRARSNQAIDEVADLVRRWVEIGVERSSASMVDELVEVARTAHHGGLVRIERELGAWATLTTRYLERDPTFRIGSWIGACNRIFWLVHAARRAIRAAPDDPAALAALGVARRTYQPVVGALEVVSLGAVGWVSDTGFVGITVHLWAPETGRFLQAAVARPSAAFGTDPRRLWVHPISERVMITLCELAHGAWALDDVRISDDGRVSLHRDLVAVPRPPRGARAYAEVAGTADRLVARLTAGELEPVGGAGGVHGFVPLAAVRRVELDQTRALASAELVDTSGAVLRVVVPIRAERDLLIDNLARLAAGPPPAGMFGRVYVAGGEVRFEPYTAVFDQPVRTALRRPGLVQEVHLGLEPLTGDAVAPTARADRAPPAPVHPEVEAAFAATTAGFAPLFASGLEWPDPDAADALRSAADT